MMHRTVWSWYLSLEDTNRKTMIINDMLKNKDTLLNSGRQKHKKIIDYTSKNKDTIFNSLKHKYKEG